MLHASRSKLYLIISFMISVTMASYALAGPISNPDNKTLAAKVNGRPIYLKELEQGVDKALARYRKNGAGSISDETKKKIQKLELDQKVAFELLVQAGERTFGKEIEQKVDERIKTANTVQADGEHTRKSAASNLNADEHRKQVRCQLLADEYLKKRGITDLRVSEAESKKYYEQNKQSFRETESVKVSHILIPLPKNPKPEEITKARKEIERIHVEIVAGKNFAELAKQFSTCASAKDGGDLGYINHGYMPKEFDDVAFSLKKGDVSDVIRTRHGFHLIKAFDKKPARIQEFNDVKDFIDKFLIKQVQANKIREIVDELKHNAKVEIFNN